MLVARQTFDAVRDFLYRGETALEDVDADLAGEADPGAYRQALWHLYRAAADIRALGFEPKAVG